MKKDKGTLLKLKNELASMLNQVLPGYIRLVDVLARSKYNMGAVELLLESPSKLFYLLKEYYGDEISAEYAFYEVFLRPLAQLLGYRINEYEFMEMIKAGKDREALMKIIKLYISVHREA